MPLAAIALLALLAAPAAAQEAQSPFIVDEDALDRRYGVGGESDSEALPPAEGAETGGAPWSHPGYAAPRERGRPNDVGRDVVDERGVVQSGQRPFFRF